MRACYHSIVTELYRFQQSLYGKLNYGITAFKIVLNLVATCCNFALYIQRGRAVEIYSQLALGDTIILITPSHNESCKRAICATYIE